MCFHNSELLSPVHLNMFVVWLLNKACSEICLNVSGYADNVRGLQSLWIVDKEDKWTDRQAYSKQMR